MPRRTDLIKLISELIATNEENGLEITLIICRQSFFILLQVEFLKFSSSEVKIHFSKMLYNRKVLNFFSIFFRDLTFKMFMWNHICPISNFWTWKIRMQITKTFSKTFCICKKWISFFLRYPFGETELIGKLWTPSILKIPQPVYRSVFEMNKYQEMGVRT